MKNFQNNIFISIIIPCYNVANFLDTCIDSIVRQKSKLIKTNNIEIILVDDASTDNNKTKNKISELSYNYSYIKAIYLGNNSGQAMARNEGLKASSGTYIAFVDADDTVNDNLFQEIENSLQQHSQPDIIIWGLEEQHFNNKNNLIKTVDVIPKPGFISTKKEILEKAIQLEEQTLLGYLWNKLYKRSMLQNNSIMLPKEHLIEDILFNINAFDKAKSINCIDNPLYYYARRVSNKTSVTSKNLPDYFNQYTLKLNNLISWYKNNDMYNESVKQILANEYLRYSISKIWRNTNSALSAKKQKEWIHNFYNLPLSKELLKYASPKGKIAKINSYLFKNKRCKLIYIEALIINIVNKNMDNLFIRLRQSR